MPLRIVEEASLTDVGRQRNSNEDSYFSGSPVFAVADGMGGARAGEVASQMAVEVLSEMPDGSGTAEDRLEAIAKEANKRIYELAQKDETRAGMGCTLTAAWVGDGEITIGHVGDSRAYRLRGDDFEQLTSDHSLVEELVRQGKLSPEEAETHPQRSIITRALGPEPDVDVDRFTHPSKAGDVYLLCSDGLTGMVADERIAELLRGRSSLDQAARALIDAANENGGRDNITVVLFRIDEAEAAAAPEEADTFAGRETQVGLSVEDVREAAAATRETPTRPETQTTKPSEPAAAAPPPAREPARDLTRMGRSPLVAEEEVREQKSAERARAPTRRPPAPAPRRRGVALAIALLVVAAVVIGLYVGSRQFWFVGTDDHGLLTLYRGVPYELPLGLALYTEEYVSSVPVTSIRPGRRRERVLDHQLRAKGDAVDLIRQYERGRAASAS